MRDTVAIPRGAAAYPRVLEACLGHLAPEVVTARGNLEILPNRKVAVFCSRRCPGDLASQAYDVAQHIRDEGLTAAGGFHSPMERECLGIFLRSPYPVVAGLGRALEGARPPAAYSRALAEGRLLLLSPFGPGVTRVTAETAEVRSRFLAALSDLVFVAHAEEGSRTEGFCREMLSWGKPLYVLDSSRNKGVLALGAQALSPASARQALGR